MMTEQVKCPGDPPHHHAGVSQAGIRKHIYSCRALKKRDSETVVYQCQYCLLHYYLKKQELYEHVKLCNISYKQKIEWSEKIHTITIAPDPYMKIIEPKEACKNWEFFRDNKKKFKEQKRLQVLQSSNSSPNSHQLQNEENRSNSPTHIDSPKTIKKVKQSTPSPSPSPPPKEISQEEKERQEKLMKENDEKIRMQYLEELKTKMKVDNYKDFIVE